MDSIEITLTRIIQSFEQMLFGHPNPVYHELLIIYQTALTTYMSNQDVEELKKQIKWTDRTILEAPGWNRELGLQLLDQITELYSWLP